MIKATNILEDEIPNRYPLINPYIKAMEKYAKWYHEKEVKKLTI